jgi:hypothetical protein
MTRHYTVHNTDNSSSSTSSYLATHGGFVDWGDFAASSIWTHRSIPSNHPWKYGFLLAAVFFPILFYLASHLELLFSLSAPYTALTSDVLHETLRNSSANILKLWEKERWYVSMKIREFSYWFISIEWNSTPLSASEGTVPLMSLKLILKRAYYSHTSLRGSIW